MKRYDSPDKSGVIFNLDIHDVMDAVIEYIGRRYSICGKHKVQVRMDGKNVTAFIRDIHPDNVVIKDRKG